MKNSQLYKGSLNTIIMKLLEEKGRMYGYEITQTEWNNNTTKKKKEQIF
jgi:DNA-binding PadR family transcriptional regulator